jgi:tetratricopeptide (TPR) repeat protein
MNNYYVKISKIALILLLSLLLTFKVSAQTDWYSQYKSALDYIEKREYTTAINLLKTIIDIEPNSETGKRATGGAYIDYYPYYHLGICYFEKGNYSEAQKWFSKSRSEGAVRANLGVYKNLKEMTRQAIRKGHKSDDQISDSTSSGREDRALRIARFMKNGRSLYRDNKYEEAAEEFRKALAADNENKSAKEWLQRSENKMEAKSLSEEGNRLYNQEKYEEALVRYRRAARLDSDLKGINEKIRETQVKADQKTSVVKSQRDLENLYQKAFNYYKEGDYLNAKINFEKVLKKDPDNSKAKYYVNDCNSKLSAKADSEESKERFDRFIGEARRSMNDGNLMQAKDYLDKASALNKDNSQVKETLNKVIDINREKMKLGFANYIEGDLEECEKILSECIIVDDSSPGLLAFLGSLTYTRYILTGEKNDNLRHAADEYFRSALRLKPDFSLNPRVFAPKVIEHFNELKSSN